MNNVTTAGALDLSKRRRVPKDIRGIESYLLEPGDVLFNATNSPALVGKSAFFSGQDEPTVFSNHFLRLRPKDSALDGRFLSRWLSLQFQRRVFEGMCRQWVNQATVSRDSLLSLRVPTPPLLDQRRIAEVLDRADALRVKRRAALTQLDTLTQAIFLDLFGDPVTNPKGWPNRTLAGALRSLQYGPRFYDEKYSDTGVRVVRITDLSESGELDFDAMPRLSLSEEDRAKYELKPGDVLFARTGATVGKVALIRDADPSCIAGAYFITLKFDESVDPVYARAVLSAPSIREIVVGRSRQAAQQNFSGPGLRQLPMPVPPPPLQHEFARRVAAVDRMKAAQRTSLAHLDALFASLQHRAFRGEL